MYRQIARYYTIRLLLYVLFAVVYGVLFKCNMPCMHHICDLREKAMMYRGQDSYLVD